MDRVIIPALLVFVMGAVSLAQEPQTTLTPQQAVSSTEKMSAPDGNVFFTDKKGVKHFVCPTCGMFHEVEENTLRSQHQGATYYFCSPKCQEKFTQAPDKVLAEMVVPAHIIAVSGDKLMAKCPVSGERVAVTAKTPKESYEGKQYFFCCEKCLAAFKKDPSKFAVKGQPKGEAEKKEEGGHKEHHHSEH